MVERQVAAMNADFPRWFREISMDGLGKESRWSGIDAIAAVANRDTVEVLVRLAFRTKAPAAGTKEPRLADCLNSFHASFTAQDETYDKNAGREVQVLAACTLAHLLNSLPYAAVAVTTSSLTAARSVELPMDLVGLAESAIRSQAVGRRTRPDLTGLKLEPFQLPHTVDPSAINAGNPATMAAPIEALRAATEKAVRTISFRASQSIEKMGRYMRIADEELQMLWWIVGDRSLDLDLPFNKVPAAAQPLVFGRELADRTVELPGPLGITALLSKAGIRARTQISVAAAVGAVPNDWITEAIKGLDASPVSTPLHYALERRLETGPGDAWVAGWAATADLPPGIAISALTLGELFYRERILLRLGT